MQLDEDTRQRIASLLEGPVTLFMKGTREAPQCGFSASVVGILDSLLADYRTVDVLADPELRDGIKLFSSWPTIPQLYVGGEFVGGCDIVQELHASGELHEKLGVERPEPRIPTLQISPAAAEGLRRATADRPDTDILHLSVDARYQSTLAMGPRREGAIEVEAGGLLVSLDPLSAQRADGARVDVVETPDGLAFRIDNPNAPQAVRPMTVHELQKRLAAGERFEFLDVRTPEERATASLPGTKLLTPEVAQRLEALPRDTVLVFHCHHGGRSQKAAEHFAALGFIEVWNISGGIEAWSLEIDSQVPRY